MELFRHESRDMREPRNTGNQTRNRISRIKSTNWSGAKWNFGEL